MIDTYGNGRRALEHSVRFEFIVLLHLSVNKELGHLGRTHGTAYARTILKICLNERAVFDIAGTSFFEGRKRYREANNTFDKSNNSYKDKVAA